MTAGSRPQQYRGGPQGYPPQGGQQGYTGQYPGPGQVHLYLIFLMFMVKILVNLHVPKVQCQIIPSKFRAIHHQDSKAKVVKRLEVILPQAHHKDMVAHLQDSKVTVAHPLLASSLGMVHHPLVSKATVHPQRANNPLGEYNNSVIWW